MPFKSETNPQAKLNIQQVLEIKTLIKKGVPAVDIAKTYNVSNSTISRIKRNKIWRG